MKIALCKSHFFGPVSGADEILVTYAIKLHQAGHDVRVVLLYKPPENDRYYERLRSAGVDVPFVIKRSVAFTILRSIRGLISSFLLLFLLIPNSERRLRKIWQSLMDLISRAHYRHCRSYFANSHYDLLHVFTPDKGAALMFAQGTKQVFQFFTMRWARLIICRLSISIIVGLKKCCRFALRSPPCLHCLRNNGLLVSRF